MSGERAVVRHTDLHGGEACGYELSVYDAAGELAQSDHTYDHPASIIDDSHSPRRWVQDWVRRLIGRNVPVDWNASRLMTRGRGACTDVVW